MNKCNVKIKVLPGGKLPKKANEHASCYDVYAREVEITDSHIIIGLGFKTEIPVGWKGVVVPRSSITKSGFIVQNSPGQIDCDYRGEWKLIFKWDAGKEKNIDFLGNRVAQIYFEPVYDISFEEVNELNITERNEGGFGSTGIK